MHTPEPEGASAVQMSIRLTSRFIPPAGAARRRLIIPTCFHTVLGDGREKGETFTALVKHN